MTVRVLRNASRIVTCRAGDQQGDIGEIEAGALTWEDGALQWVGPEAELPASYGNAPSVDARGQMVIPGLVDCHTHLAFAGSRADEFERRLLGESYLEIARRGGGIRSTMRATRAASEDELVERAASTLAGMARLGVTTVECKSGYGLSLEHELKLLRVYRRLASLQPVRLVSTFLGAHVVPPEHDGDRAGYVAQLCDEMIPAVAGEGLARFCDVFVEDGAFDRDDARRIFAAAAAHDLGAKLHVDQLGDGGGGELAAEVGAISADHLEHISERGIAAMADAGVIAVGLPFAAFFLRQPPMPARRLIAAGALVAVATDYNPGSAPSYHLPLAMLLASVHQGMTAAEVLAGATRVAAMAIDEGDRVGSLEPGKAADFALVSRPSVRDWIYSFEANSVTATWIAGKQV